MRGLLKRIQYYTAAKLGLDMMSEEFSVLAVNYFFVMLYHTLECVFVNTLLYRISPEMSIVLYYRSIVFLATGISMNIAAYVCKIKSPVTVLKWGGYWYVAMYVILFFGMDSMDKLKYIVAVFSGCGAGFTWSGHNVLLTNYTNRSSRGMGVSIMGLIQGIMTLLVPVISGFVISLVHGNAGYRVMFGVCVLAMLLQGNIQRRLAPVQLKHHHSKLRLALKIIRHKSTCKMMLAFECVRGLRDGVFLFFLNMVLFQVITEESLVGINTFLTGVVAIIGSGIYGKIAVPGRRIKLAAVSVTVLFGLCFILVWKITAFTIMMFSVINAFLILFVTYTSNIYAFDVMGQNETMRQCLPEMVGLREMALSVGRIVGIFLVTIFPDNLAGYVHAMLMLTATQYAVVLLMKLTKDTLDRKQIKRLSAQ